MNFIWPKKLNTPEIKLGIPFSDGIEILKKLGEPFEEKDEKEISYRLNTKNFDMAIYEKDGIVSSVWFNDPLGRIWRKGKLLKLELYLRRYGNYEDWELRMDNGWMHYYFNDKAGVNLVYGIHNDVIRFNLQ